VLVLFAALALLTLALAVAQRHWADKARRAEERLAQLEAQRRRIEARLAAVARTGGLELQDGRLIVGGEILFDSGSDELRADAVEDLRAVARTLSAILADEPSQMVLVAGHTDDRTIATERFRSNWELSALRATRVAAVLLRGGVPASRLAAAGFGAHRPRVANLDDGSRRKNRRIEILLVPMAADGAALGGSAGAGR
jgi:flagellar motor protein MotB